ncbi:MAG: hypothetical protein JKX99_07580 [Robiginitomaculum sp.]|nr:hypothetical protein [Robiginitomaculum sp.]
MRRKQPLIKSTLIFIAAAANLMALSSAPAQAQVDTGKYWYTTYFKATMPVKPKSGCATAQIKFVFAPNMRVNQLSAPPFGFSRAFDNTKSNMTRAAGGWCPKSMTASACEEREKLRWKYVWHNLAALHSCTTLWWNDVVIISR